ncbi:hypothetical protein FA09DRAFT_284428, partial [Tilletiopsis washingtonensis]
MAQGFKPTKVSKAPKARSGKATPTGPKRGPKVIPPKKTAAVKHAGHVRKQTASLTSRIETEMAGRASRGGPLTIMKGAADGAAKE